MATPSDLLTLQALVAELHEQVASVQRDNARLRHQLDAALHRLYGRKTERWQPPGPEQGQLPLAGDPPSPYEPPSGCAFHPRCPQAVAECSKSVPEFRELRPGHWVACSQV